MKTLKIKKTAFNAIHHFLGGKMVEFAGYEMPVQYKGVKYEHETVRNGVGIFDISHMGKYRYREKALYH